MEVAEARFHCLITVYIYTVSRKGRCIGNVPELNTSGNTSRTSLRISRSLLSSGVLRARTPYNVTRR
jgi:hypothetical protein